MTLSRVERLLRGAGIRRFGGPPTPETFAAQLEEALEVHSLGCWFPRCVDREGGGFFEAFARDWSRGSDGPRSLVFQARMTWVAAAVARRAGAQRSLWLERADHGLRFLCNRLWDPRLGGWLWREGDPEEKHAYGMAFGIYAAAAAHRAGVGPRALELADRALEWLDANAHDDEHGGYFEGLQRDGSPLAADPSQRRRDLMGLPVGCKSSNTHLHLLEAFAELYRARPDAEHRARLEELVRVVGDVVPSAEGEIATAFSREWRPVRRAVSYGHSLEAAHLLLDAAALLGSDCGRARGIADRALERGYDARHGGVHAEGLPGGPASKRDKVWWVQAEALTGLSALHERYGGETPLYRARLLETWGFVRAHVLDHRHRGWLGVVSRSGRRVLDARKGHRWKAAYHEVRALLEVAERVRRMSPSGSL